MSRRLSAMIAARSLTAVALVMSGCTGTAPMPARPPLPPMPPPLPDAPRATATNPPASLVVEWLPATNTGTFKIYTNAQPKSLKLWRSTTNKWLLWTSTQPQQFFSVTNGTKAVARGVRAPRPIRLAWNANTQTNLAGYRLYWGTNSATYFASAFTTNCKQSAFVLPMLTYYFAVTATNRAGLESAYSSEVRYTGAPR